MTGVYITRKGVPFSGKSKNPCLREFRTKNSASKFNELSLFIGLSKNERLFGGHFNPVEQAKVFLICSTHYR